MCVWDIVEDVSSRAGFAQPPLCKLDAEKIAHAYTLRSAYLPQGVVGVHKDTVRLLDKKELEMVIAHKMAHLRDRIGAVVLISALGKFFLMFGIYITCSFLAGMILLLLGMTGELFLQSAYPWVWGAAYLGSRMLIFALRQREYCADAYSVIWLGEIDALQEALRKINPSRGWLESRKFFRCAFSPDDHPELGERLAVLEKLKLKK